MYLDRIEIYFYHMLIRNSTHFAVLASTSGQDLGHALNLLKDM
jgi:hypothetical protein